MPPARRGEQSDSWASFLHGACGLLPGCQATLPGLQGKNVTGPIRVRSWFLHLKITAIISRPLRVERPQTCDRAMLAGPRNRVEGAHRVGLLVLSQQCPAQAD